MKTLSAVLRSRSAFTLAELMISVLVMSVVIVGYVGANIMVQRNNEEMHERTVAIQDANRAIEQMRNVSRTGTFPANVVAVYPDKTILPSELSETLTAGDVYNTLEDEVVTIAYVDPTANPLDVTVTVRWSSYPRRDSNEIVRAYITQR